MPLEVMWLDIPYMDKYADFSVDTVAFPDIKNYIDMLHKYSKYMVVILDAGISADKKDDPYYISGVANNTFIKSSINKDKYDGNLVTKVWPNRTVFPDWFNEHSKYLWSKGL